MGIICCYFSTRFRSANPNFGLRPKLGVRLVFGLSEKTRQKTNPKSEVAHCLIFSYLHISFYYRLCF